MNKYGKSTIEFEDDFILKQAHESMIDNHGEPPGKESGNLANYPYVTWAILDQALINRGPKFGTTLQKLRIRNGLKTGFDGKLNR